MGGYANSLQVALKERDALIVALKETIRVKDQTIDALRFESLPAMQREINEWQDRTFPHATPGSIMSHLAREVMELGEAHEPDEAADVLILLIAHAEKCKYNLWAEVRKKMLVNLQREWQRPDKEGVVEHVRSGVD